MSCTNHFYADTTLGPLNTPALDWRDAYTHLSKPPQHRATGRRGCACQSHWSSLRFDQNARVSTRCDRFDRSQQPNLCSNVCVGSTVAGFRPGWCPCSPAGRRRCCNTYQKSMRLEVSTSANSCSRAGNKSSGRAFHDFVEMCTLGARGQPHFPQVT